MAGYCRKSCGTCKSTSTEVELDPEVVAQRRLAALLAKSGAPSVADLPTEAVLEITVGAPVPAPGPQAPVPSLPSGGTPGAAPGPAPLPLGVPGPMPDVVPLHLSHPPAPAPAPTLEDTASLMAPAMGPAIAAAPVPAASERLGPSQGTPLSSVHAGAPGTSMPPGVSGPAPSAANTLEIAPLPAAPTPSAAPAAAPVSAPVPAPGPSQGILLLGPSLPYTASRKERAGDSAAVTERYPRSMEYSEAAAAVPAPAPAPEEEDLDVLRLPVNAVAGSGKQGVQVFLQLDESKQTRTLKQAASSNEV